MRQARDFLLSPTTITLLRKGSSLLILSSMGTGWILSPPDVVIMSESEWRRMVEWKGIKKGVKEDGKKEGGGERREKGKWERLAQCCRC